MEGHQKFLSEIEDEFVSIGTVPTEINENR